jgi:hypothetical protein
MKIVIAVIAVAAATVSTVSAFAPLAAVSPRTAAASQTAIFSSEPENEEEGFDLNLEEMFDM